MTARRTLLAALAALLVPVSAAPAASSETLSLTPAGASGDFPKRSWTLSAAEGTRIDARAVEVAENGRPVRNLRVTAGGEAGSAVVLVVDVSGSMSGRPIRGAMAAARAFAAERNPSQQVGVVLFNRRTRVLLPPTTDPARIGRALADTPALGPGTNINDGVAAGLRLLEQAKSDSGSIVLLSDGDDTGSRVSQSAVTAAARSRKVRVFTIGLQSRSFEPSTLRQLAGETGGSFARTRSPEALRGIFGALGARLANEVLITYESLAPGGREVAVRVDVDGGGADATASYLTPPANVPSAGRVRADDGFWASSAGLAAVALACAGLLALSAGLLLRRPRPRLEDRVSAFIEPVGGVAAALPPKPTSSGPVSSRLEGRLGAVLAGRSWWARFEEEVDVSRLDRRPAELATMTLLGTGGLFLLLLVTGGGSALALLAFAVPFVVRSFIRWKARRQRVLFEDQLADSLQVMASALRAGHSFSGALGTMVEGSAEPTRTEFARVRSDEQLGVPIDECITRVAERMQNRDLMQVAVVAALQQETGGNTAEVIDRVVENVRERGELRRLVRSLTAQGRMAHVVITILPVGLAVFVLMMNPDYIGVLAETTPGRIMVILAILGTLSGSYFIKRIIEIKV